MKRRMLVAVGALVLSMVLGASAAWAGHPVYRGHGGCHPLPPPPPCRPSHHHHHHGDVYRYSRGRTAFYPPPPPVYVPRGGTYGGTYGYAKPRGTTFGFYFGF